MTIIYSFRWVNKNSGLVYRVTEVRTVGDQYSLINFHKMNNIPNKNGSFLDLVFSSDISAKVEQSLETLIVCDSYNPALSAYCAFPPFSPILDTRHSFHDFGRPDYPSILADIRSTIWVRKLASPSADKSAVLLQNKLLEIITGFVPLRIFPPPTVFHIKDLLTMKKQAHQKYKTLCGAKY